MFLKQPALAGAERSRTDNDPVNAMFADRLDHRSFALAIILRRRNEYAVAFLLSHILDALRISLKNGSSILRTITPSALVWLVLGCVRLRWGYSPFPEQSGAHVGGLDPRLTDCLAALERQLNGKPLACFATSLMVVGIKLQCTRVQSDNLSLL